MSVILKESGSWTFITLQFITLNLITLNLITFGMSVLVYQLAKLALL